MNDNEYIKSINPSIVRSFIFAGEASVVGLLAFILNNMYLASSGSSAPVILSFGTVFIQWLAHLFPAIANLIPAYIFRFLIFRKPPEGVKMWIAMILNYVPFMLIGQIPFSLFTGSSTVGSGLFSLALSRLASIGYAALMLLSIYVILRIPPKPEEPMETLDDSTLCLSELGSFISQVKSRVGSEQPLEKLWQPIYAYLKNEELIRSLVQARRVAHDEIVLNAVGSIAFRMLASGDFHAAPGQLTSQGQYIYDVWELAAQELVSRSYNTKEEAARGLEALNESIGRAGGTYGEAQ